jgi:hypothetical protein
MPACEIDWGLFDLLAVDFEMQIIECLFSDVYDVCREVYGLERFAAVERIISDGYDACRQGHRFDGILIPVPADIFPFIIVHQTGAGDGEGFGTGVVVPF